MQLVALLVKTPPIMQKTPIWFLGQDPLEKGWATDSSIPVLLLWLTG